MRRRMVPGTRAQHVQNGKHSCSRNNADAVQAERSPEDNQGQQCFGQLIDDWHLPSRRKSQATLEGTGKCIAQQRNASEFSAQLPVESAKCGCSGTYQRAPEKTTPSLVTAEQALAMAQCDAKSQAPISICHDVFLSPPAARTPSTIRLVRQTLKLQTPVFTADMKYVIFRPYWDVPYSITQREMLRDIRANPDYLRKQHLELVRGSGDSIAVIPPSPESLQELASGTLRLRQQPGEDNALGLIKFMLPNTYNVYLHSTPAHRLFNQSRRAFSHGCIRVSDPVALATYVLHNAVGSWTPESITAAMHGSGSVRVNLTKPIRC